MKLERIAQHVDDLARATDFYTVLLDQTPRASMPGEGIAVFSLDGVTLVLDRDAPSALLMFRVDNVHEALDRVGGIADVVQSPRMVFRHEDDVMGPAGHEEWQAQIRDTEGNTVVVLSFQRA
ncbi:VOC family protein [Microbacterium koreense]|uniref:VOC family protein n=1 Tax=Microbacterium koreense TaxID=323761 RepID=A0ABW2ZPY7_9MICO